LKGVLSVNILENIQFLCKKNDMSIPKLEKELNIGNGAIYKWDKSSPSIDKLQKVADYFKVSTDYLLYGFDKVNFSLYTNYARLRRSINEFANDTGIDEYLLTRICGGVNFEQPSLDVVERIANNNQSDLIVDRESIFRAAGYDPVVSKFNSEVTKDNLAKVITPTESELALLTRIRALTSTEQQVIHSVMKTFEEEKKSKQEQAPVNEAS
jgi:transcriptional regulator with XRE-family HTH domain